LPGDDDQVTCGEEDAKDIDVLRETCDILAINRDTARFEAENDPACFKELITYRVINWCEYDDETLETPPTKIIRDIDDDNCLLECTWVDATAKPAVYDCLGWSGASKHDLDNCLLECTWVDATAKPAVYDCLGWSGASKHDLAVCVYGADNPGGACKMDNPRSACPEIIYAFDQYGDPTVKLELVSASSNWDCKITFGGVKCHYRIITNHPWTPGFFEYTQLIKVYDEEAPAIEAPDSTFCAYGTPSEDPATCYGPVKLPFTAMDNCPSNIAEVKKVELLVNRNPSTVLTAASGLFEVVRGEGNNWTIEGNLPVGKHQFVVSIMDGCGNIAGEEIDFEVIDCKAPAPICISVLSVDLMPVDADNDGQIDGGMNTVWATDFVASSIFDCRPVDNPDVINDVEGDVRYYAIRLDSLEAQGPG